ncbi:hypothetical protein D3C71_1292710 [compost metagenome]
MFDVESIARVNDGQPRDATHHGQVFSRLMAGTISGRKPGQGAAHLHIEVFLGNHLVNEVVGTACAEHRIRCGKRNESFLGDTAGRTHEQLFRHAHLIEAIRIGLCKKMEVGVLRQIGGHSNDFWPIPGQLHQCFSKGGSYHPLALARDGRNHG